MKVASTGGGLGHSMLLPRSGIDLTSLRREERGERRREGERRGREERREEEGGRERKEWVGREKGEKGWGNHIITLVFVSCYTPFDLSPSNDSLVKSCGGV